MISVIVADDHRLFLDGLTQGLDSISDISVLMTVESGQELVHALETEDPDVLLVDLEMPGLDGLAAIQAAGAAPPAIVVTMHATDDQRARAAEAGAAGFMSKGTPLPDLAAAIRAAAAGESLLEVTTLREILDRHMEPQLDPGAASLTKRERELLSLLAVGISSTADIADRLYISPKTVKNHLASIYYKLAVSDRTQAAVEAIRLGLLPK